MPRLRAATSKTRLPLRAVVLHSAPSQPRTARGRPNAAQLRFTSARRMLVAALSSAHHPPARAELTLTAVTRRLQIALADTSLLAATATPRQRHEFGALPPEVLLPPRRTSSNRYADDEGARTVSFNA